MRSERQISAEEAGARPARLRAPLRELAALPWLLFGVYAIAFGALTYLVGVVIVGPSYLLGLERFVRPVAEWLVWYSGVPLVAGLVMALVDLLWFFEAKRPHRDYREEPMRGAKVTVALTAYNDEESIGPAVRDFLAHPSVTRVIVVSNNSSDQTLERAREAGAIAVNEAQPGYGRCVYRCYEEALRYEDADLIVLSEGDCTFRAADIDKFLAYAPHADIVNGTRIVETLRERSTQLTTFMFYGNLFVAKLLEAKHLGRGTLTDVGSTYKLIRRRALDRLMPRLNPAVNLEFNAHFMDIALAAGFAFIECPITFHPRVGVSKGGNASNLRALKVGLGMMRGVTFGWRAAS
ncbi:MAG TPA: glycosyltransferase family 2 protein [Parvularculaceae bacterium]|nr:glycosyltransferase family 2 protein [Parvularculaceae bacterium]